MSAPQHEHKRVDADALANGIFNNRVTQSGPLAVDASFQFVDVRDLGTMDLLLINVKEVTDFQWFSELACGTQHEFIVVNVQTTTFAFHKVV